MSEGSSGDGSAAEVATLIPDTPSATGVASSEDVKDTPVPSDSTGKSVEISTSRPDTSALDPQSETVSSPTTDTVPASKGSDSAAVGATQEHVDGSPTIAEAKPTPQIEAVSVSTKVEVEAGPNAENVVSSAETSEAHAVEQANVTAPASSEKVTEPASTKETPGAAGGEPVVIDKIDEVKTEEPVAPKSAEVKAPEKPEANTEEPKSADVKEPEKPAETKIEKPAASKEPEAKIEELVTAKSAVKESEKPRGSKIEAKPAGSEKPAEPKAPEGKKQDSSTEVKTGMLQMFQSGLMGGWAKFDCKLDAPAGKLQWGKQGAKVPPTVIDITKAVVREYPKGFFKVDFVFSVAAGGVLAVFRADKEADKAAWLKSLASFSKSQQPIATVWASKCPVRTGPSKPFKPRFFVLYADKLSYFKDDVIGTEAGCVPLRTDGKGSVKIFWKQPRRYTVSISDSLTLLHVCFNNFADYQKWLKLLQDSINQVDVVHPPLNSRLHLPGAVLKQGMLDMRAKAGKSWEPRYFKLTAGEAGSESMLQIRQSNELGKLVSEVEISDRVTAVALPKEDRDFLFVLNSAGKPQFQVAAPNESERAQWLENFANAYRTPKCAFSICEGYLQKKGAVNTAFQERYFVLLLDRLLYYKNKADDLFAGEIEITKDTSCKPDGDSHGFTISGGIAEDATSRIYTISTENASIQEWWVGHIRHVIEGMGGNAGGPIEPKTESKPESKTETKIETKTDKVAKEPKEPVKEPKEPAKELKEPAKEPKEPAKELKEPAKSENPVEKPVSVAELTEACSCGTVFASPAAENCSSCGLSRPSAMVHTKKVGINRARKKPTGGGFKVEEPEAVRVVQVDLSVPEKVAAPMGMAPFKLPSPGEAPMRAPVGGVMMMGKSMLPNGAQVPQRCEVEGCGKWEFEQGLCKIHLAAKKGPPTGDLKPGAKPVDAPRSSEVKPPLKLAEIPRSSETKPTEGSKVPVKPLETPKSVKTAPKPPLTPKSGETKPNETKPNEAQKPGETKLDVKAPAAPPRKGSAKPGPGVALPTSVPTPEVSKPTPADNTTKSEVEPMENLAPRKRSSVDAPPETTITLEITTEGLATDTPVAASETANIAEEVPTITAEATA